MGRTGLVYDPRYLAHDMGAGHPSRPTGFCAIMQRLEQSGLAAELTRIAREQPRMNGSRWSIAPSMSSISTTKRRAVAGYLWMPIPPCPRIAPCRLSGRGRGLWPVWMPLWPTRSSMSLRGPSPGPPCGGRAGHGFCLFNNVAIAVALRAETLWGAAGPDRRLGCPSWQWHAA